MKTIFNLLLAFSFILSSFTAQAMSTPPDADGSAKIKVVIDFGRKSKGCERFGVCSITTEVEIERQAGPSGENTATGTAWMENGRLKIAFDRTSMTDETYAYHFGSGKLLLEEDFSLPADVTAALGVRSYTIKTGQYSAPAVSAKSTEVTITL